MTKIVRAYQPTRWEKILQLRTKINSYCRRVAPTEQPFQKVHDMVINAQRRKMTTGEFIFDDNVLQTKGILQATALSLRLNVTLFSDFLVLLRDARKGDTKVSINLQRLRNECRAFIGDAKHHSRPARRLKDISSWPSSMH